MPTILVVDDESDIRTSLRLLLEHAGYAVIEACDGRSALRRVFTDRPDAVLLDISMPELDGWEALDRLRDMSDVPVLLLTARDRESDRVRGLDAGADDYVVKPFANQELLARVRALLRRVQPSELHRNSIDDGLLAISMLDRSVRVDGVEVCLTSLEFSVLTALVTNTPRVLSEVQLLRLAWNDPSEVAPDRVKFVIHRLRRKLRTAGATEDLIASVRGVGYRYRVPAVGQSRQAEV